MSAADVKEFVFEQEYVTDGNLALKRLEQRAKAVEQAYNVDVRTAAKPKTQAKAKVNVGNVMLFVALVFALIMGFLYLQTSIQQNNLEINTLKNQLSALNKETAELELEIVMSEDVSDMRTTAIKDFGMVSPGEGQIVKITVEKGTVTTVASSDVN